MFNKIYHGTQQFMTKQQKTGKRPENILKTYSPTMIIEDRNKYNFTMKM